MLLIVATPPSLILIRKITAVRPPGSNTMVSSLDTLDPVTAVQMESLEHQSMSEHYSHDYEVQEPDSDTERLVIYVLFVKYRKNINYAIQYTV